jgi:uncharacterized membrane protein YphA (DoxX/SURF4 family)
MDTVLWIVQILLAIVFFMAGAAKVMQPRQKLATQMDWVEDFSDGQVKTIGLLEISGALGLILPGLAGLLPMLTPLAAVGLALTMVGAFITSLKHNEYPVAVANLILMVLALFVAFGRFFVLPL